MSFTYDFTNSPQLSQVRLLVADTNAAKPIFSDDEVNAAIQMESSQGIYASGASFTGAAFTPTVPLVYSVRRAAALLLDALAANRARLASVIELLDVKLSPSAAAQELRATAKDYRDTEAMSGNFAIAEQVFDPWGARERVVNQLLRAEG